MVPPAADLKAEDELFAKEVEEVKRWWSDSRWRNTKRPFTAEQIVSKRGNLKIDYPSNAQSKKLWDILEGRFKVRSPTPQPGQPIADSLDIRARRSHDVIPERLTRLGRIEMRATPTAA